ncbi:DUF2950 family protein [Enterobacteriaceae bacterium 89]|nr:DUF2950 family protein [Enterobacteriaceae bacterium 89]
MKKQIIIGMLACFTLPAFAQQQFASPEKAASALADAMGSQDEQALSQVLGDDWRQYLPAEGADPEAVARFLRDWKVSHHIIEQGNAAHLNVGAENWQLPIPMIKTGAGWHFDMAQGADEIQVREIGRNELSTIQAMHAYVDAQQDYFQRFQHYAKKLISSEGQKDGLYWPTVSGEDPSPLGPAYSPQVPGMGYHGYHFRILPDASKQGFALIAWPVQYGQTGIMSFTVDQNDQVWQANLGENSVDKANAVKRFAPEKPWQEVTQ